MSFDRGHYENLSPIKPGFDDNWEDVIDTSVFDGMGNFTEQTLKKKSHQLESAAAVKNFLETRATISVLYKKYSRSQS